jgi:glycosyltransferase involved in cell wall biosynthesis
MNRSLDKDWVRYLKYPMRGWRTTADLGEVGKPMHGHVLIFYPHNPFCPRHGSHLRCLQQLADLRSQYRIIFASSLETSDSDWPQRRQQLDELGNRFRIDHLSIFELSLLCRARRISLLLVRTISKILDRPLSGAVDAAIRRFFHLAWFSFLAVKYRPKAIIVHYTYWSYLSRCIGGGVRILELHDILPVNHHLTRMVVGSLQRIETGISCSDRPHIGYIDYVAQLPESVADEVRNICLNLNQYDLIWMISQREERLLRELGLQTVSDVIYPVTRGSIAYSKKDSPPILPIGPNPFNTYSLTRFIDDVIPLVDAQLLEQNEIQVTGRFWCDQQLDLPTSMRYYGIVDDYVDRLTRSAFMIAATFVGTGQQIKIFEALGAATPVIAYRAAVPADVLNEYPSIIAVDEPRDFAAMINNLLSDSGLLQHYCDLAQDGARRQAAYRSKLPYSISLKSLLSEPYQLPST